VLKKYANEAETVSVFYFSFLHLAETASITKLYSNKPSRLVVDKHCDLMTFCTANGQQGFYPVSVKLSTEFFI